MSVVNLGNARRDDQRGVMKEFEQSGKCPFCLEQLLQLPDQPVLFENEDWSVIRNRWPYEHLKTHLLLIPKRHLEHLLDFRPSEFSSLLRVIQWAEREFAVPSGTIAMRFGDPLHNGASVQHVHVHFMVGNGGGKCKIKVAQ